MDVVAVPPLAAWGRSPFVLRYQGKPPVSAVRGPSARPGDQPPPWVESGDAAEPFDFCRQVSALIADICRHTAELHHIRPEQILIGYTQARNGRGHGLQARVTPLRFPHGSLVRPSRGRIFQVQRFVVDDVEMLYLMTFCLPRFLNQSFDEKFVTLFHELFHIGPKFDGDLRRHRGRYSLHTSSKADYDARMADFARSYLSSGANPKLHGFLRLDFGQLKSRHGQVLAARLPRPKILPVPMEG